MKGKHIIWDFDGTLYDTYGAIVESFIKNLSFSYGINLGEEYILDLVKVDTKHCAKVIADNYGLNEKELLTSTRKFYDQLDIYKQNIFPFVVELCEQISKNGGYNFLVTHRDNSSLKKLLSRVNAEHLFIEVISANDGYSPKPDPESFLYLLDRYNLTSSDVLGIGDRDLDVRAAINSSIYPIYFCPKGKKHPSAEKNITCFSQLLDS